MSETLIAIPLGTQLLLFPDAEFRAALARGAGYAAISSPALSPVASEGEDWVSPRAAAKRSGTTARQWAALARDEKVKARRIGRYWRIHASELEPPPTERPTDVRAVAPDRVIPWKR